MFAVRVHQPGGPEQLIYEEIPTPRPGPGEVLIQLRAAALNHRDVWIRTGAQLREALPLVLGSDGAGVVAEVGAGVTRWRPGDEVVICPTLFCGGCAYCLAGEHSLCDQFGILGGPTQGTYAEYIVVPERNVERKPAALSWSEAAAYPLAALTAYRLLISRAAVRPGETVLIHGIGGGVATFALQLAHLSGATVIVTSSSDEKLARARELGAAATINYVAADWEQEALRLTDGQGPDVIIETVGAATWPGDLRTVRKGGRIAMCGATTGRLSETDLRTIFWRQLSVLGSTMGTKREFAAVSRLLEQGRIRPVVDRVFPLREAAAAHRRMDEHGQFGKIVLEIA